MALHPLENLEIAIALYAAFIVFLTTTPSFHFVSKNYFWNSKLKLLMTSILTYSLHGAESFLNS